MENSPLSITPETDKTAIRLRRAKSLLRRIDPRCWDDIRKRSPEQKESLSKCSDDQLFELETYPGCDYGTDTFRFACHHIGQRGGSNCWLYDEDGGELSYPSKLKEYIKQFPKRKKGVSFYVVPVNVHY